MEEEPAPEDMVELDEEQQAPSEDEVQLPSDDDADADGLDDVDWDWMTPAAPAQLFPQASSSGTGRRRCGAADDAARAAEHTLMHRRRTP
jgi:hypothetical protein